MRIFICNSGSQYSTAMVGTNYAEAFKALGMEVVFYELEQPLTYQRIANRLVSAMNNSKQDDFVAKKYACSPIIGAVIESEPDLVIFIHGTNVPLQIPYAIKKIGFTTAVILTDEPQEVDISKEYSWVYDYVFTNELNTVEIHKANASKHCNAFGPPFVVEYLPTAVGNSFCGSYDADLIKRYQCDILFFGSMYPERMEWLVKHKDILKKYDTLIVGPGSPKLSTDEWIDSHWMNQKIANEDIGKLMSCAKVFLDVPRNEAIAYPYGQQNKAGVKATNLSPRIYEAALCGSLIFTNDSRAEVTKVLDDNVIVYNDENLDTLLNEYVKVDALRLQKTIKAKNVVSAYHTYANRAETILNTCGRTTGISWFEFQKKNTQIVNDNVINKFGQLWKDNFAANFPKFNVFSSLRTKEGVHKDKVCVIVSNGPSLQKAMDSMSLRTLQTYRDKMVIIATNGAYRVLTNIGIVPDYFIIVHPEENQYERQIKDLRDKTGTLLLSSVVHPIVWQNWDGPVMFFHTAPNYKQNEELLKTVNLPIIEAGISVAVAATGMAIYFGCKKLVYVGQDFAYTNNEKYAGVPLKAAELSSFDVKVADDINDNAVLTDTPLCRSRDLVVNFSKKCDTIEFINASGGGILKGGNFKIQKLEDVEWQV